MRPRGPEAVGGLAGAGGAASVFKVSAIPRTRATAARRRAVSRPGRAPIRSFASHGRVPYGQRYLFLMDERAGTQRGAHRDEVTQRRGRANATRKSGRPAGEASDARFPATGEARARRADFGGNAPRERGGA